MFYIYYVILLLLQLICLINSNQNININNIDELLLEKQDKLIQLSFPVDRQIHFEYNIFEDNLELKILNYCEINSLHNNQCQLLLNHAINLKKEYLNKINKNISIPLLLHSIFAFYVLDTSLHNTCYEFCKSNSINDFDMCLEIFNSAKELQMIYLKDNGMGNILNQISIETKNKFNKFEVPNEHLQRHDKFITSEIQNKYKSNSEINMNDINDFERSKTDIIKYIINKSFNGIVNINEWKRICFIHSVALAGQKREILIELLTSIKESGLSNDLNALWVINHGDIITNNIKILFPFVSQWIEYSADYSRFEITTLNLLHYLSNYFINIQKDINNSLKYQDIEDIQILYLHTKGVSMTIDYPQIKDWRNLMMYYLIYKHENCKYLLLSKQFDTLGVNYISSNDKHYSGNFWWGSAKYISKIAKIPYGSNKYFAEKWLLSGKCSRIYILHNSEVDHSVNLYPKELYADEFENNNIENKINENKIKVECSSLNYYNF
jgi:hypothetical protein